MGTNQLEQGRDGGQGPRHWWHHILKKKTTPAGTEQALKRLRGFWEVYHYGFSQERGADSDNPILSLSLLAISDLWEEDERVIKCRCTDLRPDKSIYDFDGLIICANETLYLFLEETTGCEITIGILPQWPTSAENILYGIIAGLSGYGNESLRIPSAAKLALRRLGQPIPGTRDSQTGWKEIASRCIVDFASSVSVGSSGRQDGKRMINLLEAHVGGYIDPARLQAPDNGLNKNPDVLRQIEMIAKSIRNELPAKRIPFALRCPEPRWYDEWERAVSAAVSNAFPKAAEEIRVAGKCFGMGLHTACVFHAMRAAEIGLHALGASANLRIKDAPIELAGMGEILQKLHDHIMTVERQVRSAGKNDDLRFYGQAAAQLRFFNDGWRIHTAHARDTYSEHQAKEAINHVREFFEVLATRLRE